MSDGGPAADPGVAGPSARIVVVGTIVADTIVHADGSVTESLGGIAHSVAVLSALAGERSTIAPLCRVGEDCRERVTAWAGELAGVELEAVRWMDAPTPAVYLRYQDPARPGERSEQLRHTPPPLAVDDVAAAHSAALVLVNCITGSDCTPAAMAALRAACARVHLDVHSLALGACADGTRYYRGRDDWDAWLGNADAVQCNLAEAAAICGLAARDASADETLAALRERMRAATAVPRTWLLTLGAAGAVLLARRADAVVEEHLAAPAVDAVDPTGAGDAFGAGYVSAWLEGAAPGTAARRAVRAGSAAATLPGAPDPAAFLARFRDLARS